MPTVRALEGRWHLLRREWGQVLAFGLLAVALPQLAFFYAVGHLSVGVALLLEYLGMVLVVVWQAALGRRVARPGHRLGVVLAMVGLDAGARRVRGRPDRRDRRGVGVARGVGLASYFLMSGAPRRPHCRRSRSPAAAWSWGRRPSPCWGVGVLPMEFSNAPAELSGFTMPWWAAVLELGVIAAATPYVTGIMATRVLGAKLASFVGLSEVLFAVLFAWVLLGELPRAVQLVGGLFILAGVVVVRAEESRPVRIGGRDRAGSAAEANLAVGVPLVGDSPIVADDRVQRDSVDIPAAEDDGRVVGAVQEQRPV